MKGLKKYVWLLLAVLLPSGFLACSDGDEPEPEEPIEEPKVDKSYPYVNFFAINMMNNDYLWNKEIVSTLNTWDLTDNPIEAIEKARYKKNGKEVDKWTMMTDSYSEMVGGTDGVSTGTYGFGIKLYLKAEGSNAVVGFITYTHPDSPAEKAGLKRGDVILEVNGKEMNQNNYYDALFASSSVKVGIGRLENSKYTSVEKSVSMQSVSMYEDPILMTKIFDCGGKKVGYLAYQSFTFESSLGLYEVCKEFKKEGISELILDMRYNGGGYVFTEEVLASMLAPEEEVKNGSVFETEVWNDDYMAYYKENNEDLNTYFKTDTIAVHNKKEYKINMLDANIGLNKIYALVAEGSASASESILVGLLPYYKDNLEIIGEKTHGKYCTGIMYKGKDWYELFKDEVQKIPQVADWKKYIADWGIYIMISMYADKNGENPCMPDGLQPDVDAKDLFEEPYPLGDEREAMLNIALQRAGKTDLEARSVSRSASSLQVGKALEGKVNPLDGKRIHTGELIRPRLVEMN